MDITKSKPLKVLWLISITNKENSLEREFSSSLGRQASTNLRRKSLDISSLTNRKKKQWLKKKKKSPRSLGNTIQVQIKVEWKFQNEREDIKK